MAAVCNLQTLRPKTLQGTLHLSVVPRPNGLRSTSRSFVYAKRSYVQVAAEADEAASDSVGHVESSSDSKFSLSFLWLEKNIAVSVDQVVGQNHRSPLTEYFFWPRSDAWEDLKAALEAKPWIDEREKVLMLNRCTEVINFWQDENKHSIQEARTKFADCKFQGN